MTTTTTISKTNHFLILEKQKCAHCPITVNHVRVRSLTRPQDIKTTGIRKNHLKGKLKKSGDDGGDGETEEEEYDVKVWDTLNKSFRQVQNVLDQNRELIHQVNANHQSKIPDNLAKNVSLIREINGNISKVISIYSDLSVNFSNLVQERRLVKRGGGNLETGDDS